jgi:predicted porin
MTPARSTLPAAVAALVASAGSIFIAPPALAQGQVSLSGMIDLGVYRGFDDDRRVGTIQRSFLTLAGREDLGSGLTATFKLQHRFDADTGGVEGEGRKPFWHGESSVGLKGGFGHLRLGRALDVISNNDWAFDPWYNFDRIASPAWNNWHWNYASDRTSNQGSPEYGRVSNGIFYDSPTAGGFSLHFSGSFEDSPGPGGGTGNNAGLAVKYGQGGFSGLLAASQNSSDDTIQFLGLNYTAGNWSLMGAYDRSVYEAAVDSVAKVYTLGLRYALGASNLMAGYGHRDVDGAKSDFLGLGADYNLSKRTRVYASLGRQDPDSGDSATAYGVGVAHSF